MEERLSIVSSWSFLSSAPSAIVVIVAFVVLGALIESSILVANTHLRGCVPLHLYWYKCACTLVGAAPSFGGRRVAMARGLATMTHHLAPVPKSLVDNHRFLLRMGDACLWQASPNIG